ncbi:hypothetical protein GQ55_7G314800 [Panicum hallii var. hallii]|uniref:Uncharacterized protein n=1 Tax=Panicum hallii var. hallii TaxID=1504633 RepID=A0A2T7D135_9POAL|nr:hypothetical protein GQ55_7G314800 [Panicum hallii var. hallii]
MGLTMGQCNTQEFQEAALVSQCETTHGICVFMYPYSSFPPCFNLFPVFSPKTKKPSCPHASPSERN